MHGHYGIVVIPLPQSLCIVLLYLNFTVNSSDIVQKNGSVVGGLGNGRPETLLNL